MVDGMLNGNETDLDCGGSLCPGCDLGQKCAAGMDCQSGFCVDGLCCDVTCNGTCESCSQDDRLGICTPIPAREDPDMECAPDTLACDGLGGCKLLNGQSCSAGVECVSGECVDGVCCDTPCGGFCASCNQTAFEGTCRWIPAGTDPEEECLGGTDVCDGLGQCAMGGATSQNGATCLPNMAALCTSMYCVDGVCCENACDGQLCLACSSSLTGFADGLCRAVKLGSDPEKECPDGEVCISNDDCGPPP
jgi:hypothetical protein